MESSRNKKLYSHRNENDHKRFKLLRKRGASRAPVEKAHSVKTTISSRSEIVTHNKREKLKKREDKHTEKDSEERDDKGKEEEEEEEHKEECKQESSSSSSCDVVKDCDTETVILVGEEGVTGSTFGSTPVPSSSQSEVIVVGEVEFVSHREEDFVSEKKCSKLINSTMKDSKPEIYTFNALIPPTTIVGSIKVYKYGRLVSSQFNLFPFLIPVGFSDTSINLGQVIPRDYAPLTTIDIPLNVTWANNIATVLVNINLRVTTDGVLSIVDGVSSLASLSGFTLIPGYNFFSWFRC